MQKFDISRIRDAIGIIMIALSMVYFPVNTKFAAMQKEIDIIKKDHQEHCLQTKNQFSNVPDPKIVELRFAYIKESLDDIKNDFNEFQKKNEEFQKEFSDFMRAHFGP